MKIVAFEGLDASGKATQTQLLVNALRTEGSRVFATSFPRYGLPIGGLIRQWLDKQVEISDEAIHMLYEADRQDFMKIMSDIEAHYDYCVIDRYTLSNLAFGMAKGLTLSWLQDLQGLVRQPDITFVLDINSQISQVRRPDGRDRHEVDHPLLNRTRIAYDFLARSIPDVDADRMIYEINANGTPAEVHEAIIELHQNGFF